MSRFRTPRSRVFNEISSCELSVQLPFALSVKRALVLRPFRKVVYL